MTVRSRIVIVVVVGLSAVIACSLNPQPLPPDNPDGSTTTDAAMTNFGSDSGADGGGADDGASETGSASPDASPDASDAASDAEDAADAPDGGEEDAAID